MPSKLRKIGFANYSLRLKQLCRRRGKTMIWLAEQLRVDHQTVLYWNQGRSQPSLDKVLAILKLLDCTFDELVEVKQVFLPVPH